MRILLIMLLLSWGAAQHPDLPALSADVPTSQSESQSVEPIEGAETSSEVPTTLTPTTSSEGMAETAHEAREGHSEGVSSSNHNQASNQTNNQANQHGERVGPPVVNTNLAEELLILFGSFFVLAAAIGMLRFPDFYTRLHASTKLVTLGGIGILVGAAFGFNDVQVSLRVILVIVFFFLTAPLSGYMIGRAGYLRGLPFYKEWGSVDEWQALGSGSTELEATD